MTLIFLLVAAVATAGIWFYLHQRKLQERAHLLREAIHNHDMSLRLPVKGLFFGERALQQTLNYLGKDINRLLAQLSPGRQPWQTEGLRTLLKEEALCLLALSNAEGRLIGMASLLTTPQLTGLKGHVEDVVVDAVHRGKGLGKRLMANTLAHAAAAGIQSLELTSRPARKAANALYRKMGFTLRETNTYQIKGDSLTRWTAVATAEEREQ